MDYNMLTYNPFIKTFAVDNQRFRTFARKICRTELHFGNDSYYIKTVKSVKSLLMDGIN